MAIEKLSEFAKDGQKNTDDLNLTDGFSVSKKPARQWFNWLFNTLTSKVNEIIDADFIPKADIVNNLTTDDAKKPVSAKQAKALQDNKLDKTANAASASKLKTPRNIALAGAVSGNINFDGSGNITINTQLKENTAVVRAFCSFNGTGAPVILAESNIASISVSSLKFTVTFKTPMPHADYVINGFASDVNNSNRVAVITMNPDMIPSKTVNGFDFYARYSSNASTNIASPLICFSIVC